MGPRSSWIAFFRLDCSLRCLTVLGSILVPAWVPKWLPRGGAKLWFGAPLGVQDGLEIVLVRFSCRLVVRDRFLGRFGVVFGRSGGRFGAFSACQPIDSNHHLVNFWIQPINPSIHRFHSSTHRLTDSTHQPINSIPKVDEPARTRPGGLRAA